MIRRLKLSKITLLGLFSLGIISLLGSQNVFAKVSEADLVKKAANGGLYNCYHGYLPAWQIIGTGNGATFNDVSNLSTSSSDLVVTLPSGVASGALNCKEFYKGGSGFKGLFNMGYGLGEPGASDESKANFLQKVGYVPDNGAVSKKGCIAIKYTVTSYQGGKISGPTQYQTNRICASLDDAGNIDSDDAIKNEGGGTGSQIMLNVTNGGNISISTNASTTDIGYFGNGSWADLVSSIKKQTENQTFRVGDPTGDHTDYKYIGYDEEPSGGGTYVYKYIVDNLENTYSTATNNIFGSDDRKFNKTYTISLYQYYLNTYAEDRACTDDENTIQALFANGYSPMKVRLIRGGKYYNSCYIKNTNAASLNAVGADGLLGNETIKIDEIIPYLNANTPEWIADVLDAQIHFPDSEDPENSDNGTTGPGAAGGTSDDSTSENADDICYGSDGTLGMSWLVCPIATAMYKTLDGVYDYTEKHFLKLDNSEYNIFNADTYTAWQTFQTIANIIVVILLLVVIFSQLTGVGIDNYGIKKILPRLIIVAILVNLSYIVTQLAVDLSNIVGASLGSFFESMASGGSSVSTGGVIAAGTISVIGIGIAGAAVFANPALVLSFLLTLLTGVISVLMMFAILVGREVGVVAAVVIAPVAFACYLLPNTSKWTKSWANLLKGLLLLYPLCSLIIGISAFLSGIVANTGGEWAAFAAILIRVVPFFLLPTLFRRTLNAVGNLGTQIQGIGRGLNRGIATRTRNADWFKSAQERSLERRARVRAGLDQDGQETTGWRRLLRSGDNRARARYRSQYLKTRADQDKADMLNDPNYMESMLRKQQFEAEEAARDATKYAQEGYIEGKEAQGRLARENEIEGTRLYNTAGFERSKQMQYEEARQGELRKMFTEQNLREGTTADARSARLSYLLSNGLRGENDTAEAEALMDLLKDKGDIRQLIDGLNGATSTQFATMDRDARNRIAGRALASGNTLLKGWAKSLNSDNGLDLNIDDYIKQGGAGGFNNYIANDAGVHALDNADKDTLEFLVRHGGDQALSHDGAEAALASMSTTAANSSARSATAISQMLNNIALRDGADGTNVLGEIGKNITAEDLTRMNGTIAGSYGSTALENAVKEVNRPENGDLRAKISQPVKNTLGITNPPQNPPTPTP